MNNTFTITRTTESGEIQIVLTPDELIAAYHLQQRIIYTTDAAIWIDSFLSTNNIEPTRMLPEEFTDWKSLTAPILADQFLAKAQNSNQTSNCIWMDIISETMTGYLKDVWSHKILELGRYGTLDYISFAKYTKENMILTQEDFIDREGFVFDLLKHINLWELMDFLSETAWA